MDRRAFVKAMGVVVASLKAAGVISSVPPSPVSIKVDGQAIAAAVVADVPKPLAARGLIMLPTDGLVEVSVSLAREQIYSGEVDGFERFNVGPTRVSTVDLLYVTDEPIQMLMQEVTRAASSPCRLEAFGYRIDGYVVLVEAGDGDRRDRVVTRVEMRPSGYYEYDPARFGGPDTRGGTVAELRPTGASGLFE